MAGSRPSSLFRIKQREVALDSDPADIRAAFESATPDAAIEDMLELARLVLREACLPDTLGPFHVGPDGALQELAPNAPILRQLRALGGRMVLLPALLKDRVLTPEWRAANVLFYEHILRLHERRSDVNGVKWAAMKLQEQYDRLAAELCFAVDVRRGRRAEAGHAQGWRKRKDHLRDRQADWIEHLAGVQRRNPHLSRNAALRTTAVHFRVPFETVKAALRRLRT